MLNGYVIDLDIEKFFDNVDQKLLLMAVEKHVNRIVRDWCNYYSKFYRSPFERLPLRFARGLGCNSPRSYRRIRIKSAEKMEKVFGEIRVESYLVSDLFVIFQYSLSAFQATRGYLDPSLKDAELKKMALSMLRLSFFLHCLF